MPLSQTFIPANPTQYQLVKNSDGTLAAEIKQLSQDGSNYLSIPMVEGNEDYVAYQAWIAAGNEPLPAN